MSIIKSFSLIFFFLISSSYQTCTKGKNFCILCELATDLCKQCESEIFKPDTTGGCEGAKKCKKNQNHCLKCSNTSYICDTCDDNYFRDNNGGCANIENCEISENGICKKCQENYALVYKGHYYLECVSMDTEELLNCQEYDIYGHCLKCKENYYMNSGDKKCSNTQNCLYSTNGICNVCDYDYYLDKSNTTNYLCLSNNATNEFWKCFSSQDGIKCDECLTPYFLAENNICVNSKFCKLGDGNFGLGHCSICNDSYFLSEDKLSCTISEDCINGFGYNEKCKICKKNFYNNLTDGNCYSNQEDNDQKYCLTFNEKCEECLEYYYLGEDSKCSTSRNCSESYLGNCTKCIVDYYLGKLDNKCTTIKNCSKSDFNYYCEECDDGFFVFGYDQCVNDNDFEGKYKNCKIVPYTSQLCSECKNGFYLDETDYKCHDNTMDNFYKCSRVIKNSEGTKVCSGCEPPYYLGAEDLKCTLTQGCAESTKDSKVCTKCISGLCLNHIKDNICQESSYLDKEEENEICYRCKDTATQESKCDQCEEGYTRSSTGFCIDESLCDKREGGNCVQCKQNLVIDQNTKSYCLNYQYGCMESIEGCLRCDDFYNPNNCTECFKGYYLDEDFYFCNECQEGCDSCSDWLNCGACKEEEGYYTIKKASSKDSYDAECGYCGDGCKVCTNDLDCEICYSGYFLNNKNSENRMKCSQCSVWCEECFDESYCLKCMEGYKLVLSGDSVICEYNRNETDTRIFESYES